MFDMDVVQLIREFGSFGVILWLVVSQQYSMKKVLENLEQAIKNLTALVEEHISKEDADGRRYRNNTKQQQ